MELNAYKVGQTVTFGQTGAKAKYLGENLETGMAIIELLEECDGYQGHVFPKGLESQMPFSELRVYILN